ncbi:MAG: hypothetical protein DBY30_04795 [Verrucomicrobia bacterium]|nr:MAG: hypothetical protein DBY30_04795 [Verrucomicrobiota bacterium]
MYNMFKCKKSGGRMAAERGKSVTACDIAPQFARFRHGFSARWTAGGKVRACKGAPRGIGN